MEKQEIDSRIKRARRIVLRMTVLGAMVGVCLGFLMGALSEIGGAAPPMAIMGAAIGSLLLLVPSVMITRLRGLYAERRKIDEEEARAERIKNRLAEYERPLTYSCPNCGGLGSPFGDSEPLSLFRCSCGKVYCDRCSAGGLIHLPRCPISVYHSGIKKIGSIPGTIGPASGASEANLVGVTTTAICTRCNQQGTIIKLSGKSWCSWCSDWALTRKIMEESSFETATVKRSVTSFGKKNAHIPEDAIRILFDEALLHIQRLTHDQIDQYSRDWAGGYVTLHRGARQEVESLVLRHFQSLKRQPRFEDYRIHIEERWNCVFATTYYSGVANFLLLWRGEDDFAVAHT